MLDRMIHANGVVTLQSPRLAAVGVRHAFTTRQGGISPPPYDSLNLASLTKGEGDANTRVAENFRRLRHALDTPRMMRVQVHQVHRNDVYKVPPGKVEAVPPEADAMITTDPRHLLTIRTADCVPILLASSDGGEVAAVHAGWRGVVAGVVPATVRAMACPPEALVAAVGPCICVEHFEVSEDVAGRFDPTHVDRTRGDRPHVDLPAAVAAQLAAAGVSAIDRTDACTYRDAHDFFSHRRDVTHRRLPDTGRMAAVIAAK